jgi:hypothetical protein
MRRCARGRCRLFRNHQARDLVVRRLRNNIFLHQIRLRAIRTPVDNLLRIRGADSRQRHQLVLRRRVQVHQIAGRRCRCRLCRRSRALRSGSRSRSRFRGRSRLPRANRNHRCHRHHHKCRCRQNSLHIHQFPPCIYLEQAPQNAFVVVHARPLSRPGPFLRHNLIRSAAPAAQPPPSFQNRAHLFRLGTRLSFDAAPSAARQSGCPTTRKLP